MNDKIATAPPEPPLNAHEIAKALAKAIRKAKRDPFTGNAVASVRVSGGVVSVTMPAKERR